MATSYRTPGVYVEEISTLPASVAAVATAIPIFAGATEIAEDNDGSSLLNIPTRISSMLEYEEKFGKGFSEHAAISVEIEDTLDENDNSKVAIRAIDVTVNDAELSDYRMYYALQMFFANGGRDCWILSVALYDASMYNIDLLETAVDTMEKEDEPTLILFTDRFTTEAYKDIYDYALSSCNKLKDRFTIMDIWDETDNAKDDADKFRDVGISMDYLSYGAAYYPMLKTTLNYAFDEEQLNVIHKTNDPSVTPSTVTDGDFHDALLTDIKKGDNGYDKDSSLYNILIQNIAKDTWVKMAPGSAMAGIFARVDNDRGVWKAPANVSVKKVSGPTIMVTNAQQETLNVDATSGKSINVIRAFTGKGTLVWGSRTLAGNDNEWRYVPVRRFFIFVEESVKKATEFVVFEPNDAKTWLRVKTMIENFLNQLWKQGALQGAKPADAFFVNVGLGITMTAQDILEGRMNVEIGMAAVRPAEFIILKFSHKLQQS
ncbi:MAG: phage tail sheath family protein [Bacteroidia bacterium]|nr:phage tail sheath family protein [Bacteroidia bacterium]